MVNAKLVVYGHGAHRWWGWKAKALERETRR